MATPDLNGDDLSGGTVSEYLGWQPVADLIVSGLKAAIAAKVGTYDFARLMDGATKVKCGQFADEIIRHVG